jgi:AraC-like DNA-binding protein
MKRKAEVPIDHCVQILKGNIKSIDRVGEWSEICGYNDVKKFSRLFRNHFGIRPKKLMNRIKLEIAINLLSEGKSSNYEIARDIGKKDEKVLYTFFKQQTGKPPEIYKRIKEE